MTSTLDATRDLVNRSLASLDDLPAHTLESARKVVLDTLGCMIGSRATPEAESVFRWLDMTESGGAATIVGGARCASPEAAAYANAILGHILEMDDTHRTGIIHPAAPIFSAALAVAELVRPSGVQFLRSIILGYEVGVRIARAIQPSHWYAGYLSMGTCGAVGAAASCGYLLGLDASRIAQAVGLAGIQAGGLNVSIFADGDMGKLTTPASGAANGVRSAYLVASGMTGPETIVEGRFGILEVWSSEADWGAAVSSIGETYAIDETGFKPLSCCRYIHGPLELLAGLMDGHRLSAEMIQSIDVRTYEAAVVGRPHRNKPLSSFDAKMSIPYCLAVLLDNNEFSERAMIAGLERVEYLGSLASRVVVSADEEMTRDFPTKWHAAVTVTDLEGKEYSASLDFPKGEPENPLTMEELIAKFVSVTADSIPPETSREIVSEVFALSDAPIAGGFFARFRAGKGAGIEERQSV